MQVRIFRRSKSATQSGRANADKWVVDFVATSPKRMEPLMGWTSSSDTRRQLRLEFDSREEAVGYAEKNGHAYTVEPEHERKVRPKSYSDNFKFDRIGRWTH